MPKSAQALAAVLLLATLAFLQGMRGGFVWDDRFVLVENPAVRDLANLPSFFTDPHTGSSNPNQFFYRPLRTSIYALAYQVWGLDPLGYHVVNLILHLANVCLLLLVLRRLGAGERTSLFTSAVFAVHPIVTEAVTNITGLTDVLFVFFYLLAWIAHLRATQDDDFDWKWAVACWAGFAAALLSKEMALTFPLLAAAADQLCRTKAHARWTRTRAAHFGIQILIAGAYVVLRTTLIGNIGQKAEWPGGNPWRTWLMQCEGIVKYVQLVFFPVGQSIRHTVAIPDGIADPYAAGCLLAVLLLAGTGVLAYRRRARSTALGVAWFFIALLPAMNIVPIRGSMLGERFLYLPMIGLTLAAVSSAAGAMHLLTPRARTALACCLLLVLATMTARRNRIWQSDLTAFENAATVTPESNAVRANLVRIYRNTGRDAEAAQQLDAMLANMQRFAARYTELGDYEAARGDYEEAAWWYRRALSLVPGDPRATAALTRIEDTSKSPR